MNLRPNKWLGQNFLNNHFILTKIIQSTKAQPGDLIIEIGPGQGSLTRQLKKLKAQIIAFEIDNRMQEYLTEIEDTKTTIVYADFLKINLLDYCKPSQYNHIYFIANLPYYIATKTIKKIILSGLKTSELIFLVQKEYANRILASVGTKAYDSLTIMINFYFEVKKIIVVPKEQFRPQPKVDGMVLKFIPHKTDSEIDDFRFLNWINQAFRYKRKILKHSFDTITWNQLEPVLKQLGYNSNIRAEQIKLTDWIHLFKTINL